MGWDQLKEIAQDNAKIIREEEAREVTECPECLFRPLKTNDRGEKLCPICGWRSI